MDDALSTVLSAPCPSSAPKKATLFDQVKARQHRFGKVFAFGLHVSEWAELSGRRIALLPIALETQGKLVTDSAER